MVGKAAPRELMLVVDTPAAGLAANEMPSIESIPNNHLAYAVQWFLFAGIAVIIYLLALRRRARKG
jgi:surfeit locus 1 family protein